MTDKKTSMLTIASLLAGGALVFLAITKRKVIMAAANEGITTLKGAADKMASGLIGDPLAATVGLRTNGSGEAPIPARGH